MRCERGVWLPPRGRLCDRPAKRGPQLCRLQAQAPGRCAFRPLLRRTRRPAGPVDGARVRRPALRVREAAVPSGRLAQDEARRRPLGAGAPGSRPRGRPLGLPPAGSERGPAAQGRRQAAQGARRPLVRRYAASRALLGAGRRVADLPRAREEGPRAHRGAPPPSGRHERCGQLSATSHRHPHRRPGQRAEGRA